MCAEAQSTTTAAARRVSLWDARNGRCKMQHDAATLLGAPRRDVACATLGVPVYENLVESTHVVFSTYLAFKNNPFLRKGEV